MPLLIALLIFACVTLVVIAFTRPASDNVVLRRIRGESGALSLPGREQADRGFAARVIAPLAVQLGGPLTRLLPHNVVRTVDRMLVESNSKQSTATFLTIWACAIALGIFLYFFVISSQRNPTVLQSLMFGILVVGPFAIGPYAVLRRKVKSRKKAITRALPDALDLLVTGVEAGLGVDAAFSMVTEKTGGPLAEAFAQYLRQVGLGRSRREAFAEIAERTGVIDLIRVAGALTQAEQMGATLGDVLRVQAEDLRDLRRQRAQEAAQRAPVLMTIPMALCFLPAMGAVVIVPSILNLLEFMRRMGGR